MVNESINDYNKYGNILELTFKSTGSNLGEENQVRPRDDIRNKVNL